MESYEIINFGIIELGEEFYYYNELDPKNYDQIRTTIDELKNKYALIIGIAKKIEPGKDYKYEVLFWHKGKQGWRKIHTINKQLSELYLTLSASEILSIYQEKNINSGDIIIEYRISEIKNFQPDRRVPAFGKIVNDLKELEDIKGQFINIQKGIPTKDVGTADTIPEKPEKKGFMEQINDIFKNASRLILLIIIAIVVITAIRFIKK
jgi:energy-coupling factor transporter ATP-binding protein EcfA2